MFDKGWNDLREQIFANQKRLGVIPADTQLTPWPDGQPEFGGAKLAKWDTLIPTMRKNSSSVRRTSLPPTRLTPTMRLAA